MKKKINIFILVLALMLAVIVGFIYSFEWKTRAGQESTEDGAATAGNYSADSDQNGLGSDKQPVIENSTGILDSQSNASVNPIDTADLSDVSDSSSGLSESQLATDTNISVDSNSLQEAFALIHETGTNVAQRVQTPVGFERIIPEEGSFGDYLGNLPLKPHGARVKYYDGSIKPWDVHVAVLDIDVGKRDLQQCADAVMRLRAEYLYSQESYDQIHFNFTNGFNAEYKKWIEGNRVKITGNKAEWVKQGSRGTDYESFRKYLDIVFAYAGTLSLSKEMDNIDLQEMQTGDVFLKGGSPGHCIIVMDMAENPQTGEKIFIAAQSYMPAQDIHILKNPANEEGNPWYPLDFGEKLTTPEWTFTKEQVYRFAD